jgi:hypothetical protein
VKNVFSFLFFLTLLITSCDKNILSTESSQDSDDQYYSEALNLLNGQNYEESILILTTKISAEARATVKVRQLLASGYAGKCGLNFIDYTSRLSNASSGSALMIMMTPFVQRDAFPDFCKQAIDVMEQIGSTETRTVNQNIFSSILGMVLLGTSLRSSADQSPLLGDGTADVDICAGVTDEQIDNMIIGFGYFSKNFSSVSSSMIGSHSTQVMTEINSTCQTVAGTSCQITNSSQITPSLRSAFRDLVNTLEYGIGSYVTGGNQVLVLNSCP